MYNIYNYMDRSRHTYQEAEAMACHVKEEDPKTKPGLMGKVKGFFHDKMSFGKPTAQLAAIHLSSMTLKKADLVMDLLITNPTPLPIPLLDIDYLVESRERNLISGLIPDAGTIRARGQETVKVPVTLVYDQIRQTYREIHPGTVIPYRVKVKLILDVPVIGRLTLPLETAGEIPVPLKPEVDVVKVKFEKFSLEETLAVWHVRIENRNEFGLRLNSLNCEFWLVGVRVGGAEVSKTAEFEKCGVCRCIEVPVSFRPKDFGSAIWDLMRHKGTGGYSIKGHVDADTPFGAMKLPISKEGGSTSFLKNITN